MTLNKMGAEESKPDPTKEECPLRKQAVNPQSGEPYRVADLLKAGYSTCKIMVNLGFRSWLGTGFFVYLPVSGVIRGIMTNNHVLGYDELRPGFVFRIKTDLNNEKTFNITILGGKKIFSDNLLDITFIELLDTEISKIGNIKFLNISTKAVELNERICIMQHPLGNDLSFAQGNITEVLGIDLHYTASTRPGSSGSAVLNDNLQVVGVNKMGNNSTKINIATRMDIILSAITLAKDYILDPMKSASPPKILSSYELSELSRLGFKPTSFSNIFYYAYPIFHIFQHNSVKYVWFYRTNHAWYYSYMKPDDLNDDISVKMCDWNIIIPNENLEDYRVIQSINDSYILVRTMVFESIFIPEFTNQKIIKKITKTGFKYII